MDRVAGTRHLYPARYVAVPMLANAIPRQIERRPVRTTPGGNERPASRQTWPESELACFEERAAFLSVGARGGEVDQDAG
jgi:hypothetical protein